MGTGYQKLNLVITPDIAGISDVISFLEQTNIP
jgi:hypothetical protein